MISKTLLRAVRDVFILVPRAGEHSEKNPKFWALKLNGLHHSDIKSAASSLRKDQKERGRDFRGNPALKVSNLQSGTAQTMGAKSYNDWRDAEKTLLQFLCKNGMKEPANLIEAQSHTLRLGPVQVSERIFNAGLPVPEKIFTGVGSTLFEEKRARLADQPGLLELSDMEIIEWCRSKPTEHTIFNLSRRQFVLHAYTNYVQAAVNLLGDSLTIPSTKPKFRLYQADKKTNQLINEIYSLFREEITSSSAGWVDVVPMPENNNICFLKGTSGKFDWVIRDQRNHRFSGNPYYPSLQSHDLPSAMDRSKINAHLYFTPGRWLENLQHTAEEQHYKQGGTSENWPGYEKLIERELIRSRGYHLPSPKMAPRKSGFRPHPLPGYCLMVSELITIEEIQKFITHPEGAEKYRNRRNLDIKEALSLANSCDLPNRPASVFWYAALAFCKYYEDQENLPVRLITIDEWKSISPFVQNDFAGRHGHLKSLPQTIILKDGQTMRFHSEPQWIQNGQGTRFVNDSRFGEWLADYSYGLAPAACVATGESILLGPIERALCPADSTLDYKSSKVGFRICYVANTDA